MLQKKLSNLISLIEFSNTVNKSLNFKFILDNLILTCLARFQTSKGMVILTNEKVQNFDIVSYKGIQKSQVDLFRNKSNITLEDILPSFNLKKSFVLQYDDKVLGYLLLGDKFTNQEYDEEELTYLSILANIASISLTNATSIEKIININNELKIKINQLTSLFELSQEFNLTNYDREKVYKLLTYTIIGQFMVTKYAIIELHKDDFNVIEDKINLINNVQIDFAKLKNIDIPLHNEKLNNFCPEIYSLGVELVVPMVVKNKIIGYLFLGQKLNREIFSESDIEFITSIASLASLTIENINLLEEVLEKKKIEKELEIASEIQKNLLPSTNIKIENIIYHGVNLQSKQVGGDYYDIIKLNENRYVFAIADVSGKSVSASLLMANFQAFLKSLCKTGFYDIVVATNLLNDLLSENIKNFKYITFLWGILDTDQRTFEYVNAGHNPGILIRDGHIIKLDKGGIMLGLKKYNLNVEYEKGLIELQDEDLFIFHTDGVTEAKNLKDELFEEERFYELCKRNANLTPEELNSLIIEELKKFSDGAEQSDDITLLSFKIKYNKE
jgi:sigma-B regulation protein RsbU (phosphoserine phosphatase)